MITSISETFYDSLKLKPPLTGITEFGLSVLGASGSQLPYKGYIEADISVPFLGNTTYTVPLLVVLDTEYDNKVPAIIETNVIRLFKQSSPEHVVPIE